VVPVGLGVLGARGLANHPSNSEKAHTAAESFMSHYVRADGRVVRTDQGGDTVSEGQAYAMLLAVALDDSGRFQQVWGWTHENLQQPDGLLAFRWADGRVASDQPATDADLDAARALVLAGTRFQNASYTREGAKIGEALLGDETSQVNGLSVLAAGPWATGVAPTVNPSYFSPRAYADLASAHADPSWDSLAGSSRAITEGLTSDGSSLPPDWARVQSLAAGQGGQPTAHAAPISNPSGAAASSSGSGDPASGLDALRVAIRSAESCVPADRQIAAKMWPLYRSHPGLATYRLDGTPVGQETHAASYVAAAAAAKAAGDDDASNGLLDQAQEADSAHPTYYGSAWVALGRVMLTSSALGSCPS